MSVTSCFAGLAFESIQSRLVDRRRKKILDETWSRTCCVLLLSTHVFKSVIVVPSGFCLAQEITSAWNVVNRFQENQKSTAREKVARAARVAVAACDFADLFLQVPMESQWIQLVRGNGSDWIVGCSKVAKWKSKLEATRSATANQRKEVLMEDGCFLGVPACPLLFQQS